MRLLFKSLGWLLTLAVLATAVFVVLMVLDRRPLVPEAQPLTDAKRTWARQWLHDARPRGMKDGAGATLTLSEEEANVLAAYLIDQVGRGRVKVRIEDNRAQAAASLGLPWDPGGSFLNAEFTVAGTAGLPRIEQARVVGLPLPGGLLQTLADRLMNALDRSHLLQRVDFKPKQMQLTYQWHRNALETLGSGLLSSEDLERLLYYQGALSEYGKGRGLSQSFQLADLLSHLLTVAHNQAGGADPVQENRAVILALAAYTNVRTVRPVGDASGRAADAPRTIFHRVLLRGRRDLAQHFMTSAAVVTQGGNALSDLVGLFKEIADSRGGSGFSFADLAADRAGTRFAERATGDRAGALATQTFAQKGLREDDFMPAIDGLPEGLSQDAFAASFQDTKSPAYRRLVDHIERRIDARALYRSPEG